MDQASKFELSRSIKSKAIPIINPNSGATHPIPAVVDKPASTFPASLHLTSKLSGAKSTLSTPINAKNPPIVTSEEDSVSGGIKHPFNVYALPFVPEAYTIINTLPGRKVDTSAINQIDFGAYVHNFVGLEFLPPIPPPVELPVNASLCLTDNMIHMHYEQYFRYHLEAEMESQEQENQSYSLYGHDVTMLSSDFGQPATCSFLVPGLRENSPYIEEDDIVQLRELCYDYAGKLLGMEGWLASSGKFGGNAPGFPGLAGRYRDESAPGWTGIVYNARVLGVRRKQEQLLIRVCDIVAQNETLGPQHSLSGKHHLKFNVQFPVPKERYLPMRQVLPIIQKALRQANDSKPLCQDTCRMMGATRAIPSVTSPGSCSSSQLQGIPEASHQWLQSMLFPTEANCEVQTKLNTASFNRPFFDELLNWEQQKAIESICSYNYGNLPFLVSGPPGTGKTKTLVETALQLINNVDNVSHILFCAPSDPAADTIVQRLGAYFQPAELLRLNRAARTFAEVPDAVLPFCYVSQNRFYLPPFRHLMSYKIVVTTCRDASLLMYSRLTNSDLYAAEYGLQSCVHPYSSQPLQRELHWTALLIDEAAQATEPEVLIPLSVVAPPLESVGLAFRPLFVMAGDEHQLGPRTSLRTSPLKTSLFARLFARPVYAGHLLARSNTGQPPPALKRTMLPIIRPAFANLIRNYRSHPAILAIPSAVFYADSLEPEATDTGRLASWSQWRGRRWPLLFHSNVSEDDQEKDGGGWYNIGEAQIACRYAADLVVSGLVDQSEICIMSPFKAQVQRLRKTIQQPQYGSLWDVDIGPTEAFQGLERGVVILCTTRSKQYFINDDQRRDWGIIGMPNRMNVALTRAKFGLIVIGKRESLLQDPCWKYFLRFCERNGLEAGKTNSDRQIYNEESSELTRLEKVLLTRESDKDRLAKSRVLKGISQDDEMWTRGIQAALNMERMNRFDYGEDE